MIIFVWEWFALKCFMEGWRCFPGLWHPPSTRVLVMTGLTIAFDCSMGYYLRRYQKNFIENNISPSDAPELRHQVYKP